jgi:hypothetical protein
MACSCVVVKLHHCFNVIAQNGVPRNTCHEGIERILFPNKGVTDGGLLYIFGRIIIQQDRLNNFQVNIKVVATILVESSKSTKVTLKESKIFHHHGVRVSYFESGQRSHHWEENKL